MLSFLERIKRLKDLFLNKLDQILLQQIESTKIIHQIEAIQRSQKIILEKHSGELDKIFLLLKEKELSLGQTVRPGQTEDIKKTESLVKKEEELITIPFFQADFYQRINQRRLEHLATLNLPVDGSTVLEVGAGIGDHTSFFIDRRCEIVSTEARPENLKVIRTRYPNIRVEQLDLDAPDPNFQGLFDIVYCYGLLYHLRKPEEAISFMAERTKKMLLLETCVSFGEESAINFCNEPITNPTQSFSGTGCRPTRIWIYQQLKKYFRYVYLPITQPNHEQFPLEWDTQTSPKEQAVLVRSIFIASNESLSNPLLTENLLKVQFTSGSKF